MYRTITFIIGILISLSINAQNFEFGGRFIPAKQELETEITYNLSPVNAFGVVHNEEKRYFDPYADKFTITYFYFNIEIIPGLRVQPAYGVGYRRDLELSFSYERKWLYFEVGRSETEPIFFEFKISF